MAEGGDKQAERLGQESDDFHEYPCLPCAKDNRNVAAIKFCVDCDENICGQCVAIHNRYAGMKGHQISDTIKTNPGQGGPGLPNQRCEKHTGKLIDVYCADHDIVGCATCIAIEHRSCDDVAFIPDMAPRFQTSKALQDLTSAVLEMETRTESLKQLKADCVKHMNQDKENILKEISLLRKKINDHLDQVEKTTLEQVDTFFELKQAKADDILREINSVNVKVTEIQEALNNIKDKNESTKIVELKMNKAILSLNSDILKLLEDSLHTVANCFNPSVEIENVIRNTSSFGYVSDNSNFISGPTCCEFNVRLLDDQSSCDIKDICLTKSGDFVFTDSKNKKIKIFDGNCVMKEVIVTPVAPFGVCEIDDSQLATTMFVLNQVQFLSRNPLKLTNSFEVGDRCRGIKYQAGKIYVCCGGMSSNTEDIGHIEVYNLEGHLLRSYYESLQCPWYMHISAHDADVFVSDNCSASLVSINLACNKVNNISIPNVIKPSGSCNLNATQQLICGFLSNNIVLQSADKQPRELLTEKDGIVKPRNIVYDKEHSRLIVIMDKSDIIKVFRYRD